MSLASVIVKPRRAKPFYGMHPWVFAGAVQAVNGEPADGAEVDLVTHTGNFVARGFYNSQSKIVVRLYTWEQDERLDEAFFRRRLLAAICMRHEILQLDAPDSACRLVFSEADGLSGLTLDRYQRWLVLQFSSLALAERRELLVGILRDYLKPDGIYLRTERGIGQLEGLELQDGPLFGELPSEPLIIREGDVRFLINLAEGQKTGFYLDQRDNRQCVARLARGRRVLDAFCYSGGFGLHAAGAGAATVLGIDGSEAAIALARANARLNGLEQVQFERADVFDKLDALVQAEESFGLIVLDPPKFARAGQAVEDAMRGYRRLQALALRLLEEDSILVVCCCSGLISREMLMVLLAQVAADARRTVQILENRGPGADHPALATCPETNYLKCLICRVS